MEVRDWLKRASDNGNKPVKQIVFAGERFDVMSVRRWRERVLGGGSGEQDEQDLQDCRRPVSQAGFDFILPIL